MRCYFIDQIYMKNIWVKLNSETPDFRTDGFLKMRLSPGTGEHPVSKGQLFTMATFFSDGNFTWEEGEDSFESFQLTVLGGTKLKETSDLYTQLLHFL